MGERLSKIRRREKVMDEAWIRSFLADAQFGIMATARDNQPFIVARNFAYDGSRHAIYMHGAVKGRTFDNLLENKRVCFSVFEMGRLLPADEAIEVGVEYSGVVAFGKAEIVKSKDEAFHGLQLLLDKYFPHLKSGKDYQPLQPEALKVTAVIRIDIEEWSGKEEKEADDFPGAFIFGDFPEI